LQGTAQGTTHAVRAVTNPNGQETPNGRPPSFSWFTTPFAITQAYCQGEGRLRGKAPHCTKYAPCNASRARSLQPVCFCLLNMHEPQSHRQQSHCTTQQPTTCTNATLLAQCAGTSSQPRRVGTAKPPTPTSPCNWLYFGLVLTENQHATLPTPQHRPRRFHACTVQCQGVCTATQSATVQPRYPDDRTANNTHCSCVNPYQGPAHRPTQPATSAATCPVALLYKIMR
jgi:hypothetical protein